MGGKLKGVSDKMQQAIKLVNNINSAVDKAAKFATGKSVKTVEKKGPQNGQTLDHISLTSLLSTLGVKKKDADEFFDQLTKALGGIDIRFAIHVEFTSKSSCCLHFTRYL